MGKYELGLSMVKRCSAWVKASGKSNILATKPVKNINVEGLKFSPKNIGDTITISKHSFKVPSAEKLQSLLKGQNIDSKYVNDNNGIFLENLIKRFPIKSGEKKNIAVEDLLICLEDINHLKFQDKSKFLDDFIKNYKNVDTMFKDIFPKNIYGVYSKRAVLQAKYNNPERYKDIMNLYDLYKQGKAPKYTLATLFPESSFHKLPKSDMNKLLNGENYYPKLSSLMDDSISKIETGEVFSVGEEMFVKTSSGYEKLKIDAKTYEKLFPPIERYTLSQGPLKNCHLMSTMDSIIKNPEGRIEFYKMFEQVENGVKCTIPGYKNSGIVYNFDNLSMLHTKTSMKGSLGHKMIEHTYAKNYYDDCLQSPYGWRAEEMTKGDPLKIFDVEGDYENVADHIKNLLGKMSETIDHRSGKLFEETIIDSALKKQKGISIVNCVSNDNLKKGIYRGHFYNADLNTRNIINPWNTMEEIHYNPFDLSDITFVV